jgi:lauroyl/myristoyl acyltransferase
VDAETIRLFVLSWVARLLGPLRYPVADQVGRIRFRRQHRERQRAISNFLRLSPEVGRAAAVRLARRSFCEYVRTETDFLRATTLSASRLRGECVINGADVVGRVRGRGAVFCLCHFGNWDMAGSIAASLGVHVCAVMAPVGSPATTEFVRRHRARFGLELLPPHHSARRLVRALSRGEAVGLMCDIVEAGPTVRVSFCGGQVSFTAVAARLARRAGVPLVPVDCWREGGRYRLQLHSPIDACDASDAETTQKIAAVLELAVRRRPEQWYPFHRVFLD